MTTPSEPNDAPAAASRRYLITGGTSGIGEAAARHLSAAGHLVWVVGTRDETVARSIADKVAVGGSVADVANADAIETAFSEAETAIGPLDGAFLNAGIDGEGAPAERLSPLAFAEVLKVNTVGVLASAQAAYRHLARPGNIVINASVNALRPETGFADYNASKAAAVSLAKSFALEWSHERLSVTAVCPGYFRSRMTAHYLDDPATAAGLLADIPAKRFGASEDIGALLEFLLGPNAGYLTGATISLDGGRAI